MDLVAQQPLKWFTRKVRPRGGGRTGAQTSWGGVAEVERADVEGDLYGRGRSLVPFDPTATEG